MSEISIHYRNKVNHSLYKHLLKPVLFQHDPEYVHDKMTEFGEFLGNSTLGQKLTKTFFDYENSALRQKIFGIHFSNPIGLSAGFDKDAKLTGILPHIGFGFAEAGSITGSGCAGNPKPRLWRLPHSQSLSVYYGLKNDGSKAIAKRLSRKHFAIPIGMNIAMTNCNDNLNIKNAVMDYAQAFRTLEPIGNYLTINISCPNTTGGQPFINDYNLDYLLDILDEIPSKKPIFLKLSPDLDEEGIDKILEVAKAHRVSGIICTNLTKKRFNFSNLEKKIPIRGGLSGKPLSKLSDKMISYIYKKEGKRFILIGSGGIFNAEDAYRKIRLGASLLQLITGMIYEGPQVISEINQGLVKLLKRDGFANISEAVGIDNR